MARQRTPTERYTDPTLREQIKKNITASDKGGRPGQWSARKVQLYSGIRKAGGGYKGGKDDTQKSLEQWGEEQWTTSDGKKAVRGKETKRYLPKEAWNQLSDAEKKSTNRKKVDGSRSGEQFVANTTAAKKARKRATKKKAAKR